MIYEGQLGEWKYEIEAKRGLGRRVIWINPPPAGTVLFDCFDNEVVVDEVGLAGMLHVTRKADGCQCAQFPQNLKLPKVPA